jgi:hypothetical protein
MAIITTLAFFQIMHFSSQQNPTTPVTEALSSPQMNVHINPNSSIYTHDSTYQSWSNVYSSIGWHDLSPFLYFKNNLGANQNLIWDTKNIHAYSGIRPQRMIYQFELPHLRNMHINTANYMITTTPVEVPQFNLITQIEPPNDTLPPHFLYQNSAPTPRFYFTHNYSSVENLSQAVEQFQNSSQNFQTTPVLETQLDSSFSEITNPTITITKDTHQHITLETTTNQDNILIIGQSYYPGWIATINNQPTQIIPANINQQALIVPKGTNIINLKFEPQSLKAGATITAISILIMAILIYFNSTKARKS